MSQNSDIVPVDLQRYKVFTQSSDIPGEDGFKLFIDKIDTITTKGQKYSATTNYVDSGDNGIEIFFTSRKQSEIKSEPSQQSSSNKTEIILWEKSCLPERHYLYRIMQEIKPEEPVVAKLMEHVIIFDRPCLFRLSDLIKQFTVWKTTYKDYLEFKSHALGNYVDPPHPFSELYHHLDDPACECKLCAANRNVVEILEKEGVTLDHVLDSAIDCVKHRLSNIMISQLRMSFLKKSKVFLGLSDGFEAIVPPLTVLRFEKLFKELYDMGMTISWEILKKLSLILSYGVDYNAAIHFIDYLFDSADKFVEVAERLEPMFICFDWKLIHCGLYFKVFLLHSFQEFVFQSPEVTETWKICRAIVRQYRKINPNRPGEKSTKEIMDKYDALVVQMNIVRELWEAKLLPFDFEEIRLPIHNVLKISSLFPPYRPLEENVKMTYTAVLNEGTQQYELGPLAACDDKVLDLDPILDVCLTNPKNKDEKVCIQVLCKDKPIIGSTEALAENTQWGLGAPFIQAVRKIFGSEFFSSEFLDTMTEYSSSLNNECKNCLSKLCNTAQRKHHVAKRKSPRFAIYGPTANQKLASRLLRLQKRRESCQLYEKKSLSDRTDYLKDKHGRNIADAKCPLASTKHRTALQDILSFAMKMGTTAVSSMEAKVTQSPQNYKFYVVFHYSKCKVQKKKEPKILIPLDQIMALLLGTLHKHNVLTEKELKSVFLQQYKDNQENMKRDPNAKNVDWEACNANIFLSAKTLTSVENPPCDKKETNKRSSPQISEEGEEFLRHVNAILETSFKEPMRKKVKQRLLEAFQPLLNFSDTKDVIPGQPRIYVKGFDKLRPLKISLSSKYVPSIQEMLPNKVIANPGVTRLTLQKVYQESSNKQLKPVSPKRASCYLEGPPVALFGNNMYPLERTISLTGTTVIRNSLATNEIVATAEAPSKTPKVEINPEMLLPPRCPSALSRSSSLNAEVSSEEEEIDVVNCCGTPGCSGNHGAEARFEHVHGCLGGSQADPNCECYKGRSVASMLLSEDYHRCSSQVSGLPVNPKYSQMRQKLLKTLRQRQDTGEECETSGNSTVQKSAQNTKSARKKETIVVPKGTPPTEDVDALVSMIEGTSISSDPKKAAKRARQKARKIQLQKEEEEKRLKVEEELRKVQLQKEAERLRLEEERIAKERQEAAAASKKSKKKKNKNKGASQVTVTAQVLSANSNESKYEIMKMTNDLVGASAKPGDDKSMEHSKTEKKTDMVTIRRHPTVPDTTVTISMKSNSGHEDVLYTLINGQVYETDAPDIKAKESVQPQTGKSSKKKKKAKAKENSLSNSHPENVDEPVSKKIESTEFARRTNPASSEVKAAIESESNNNQYSFLNTLSPESEIDLSKLKLPPGITITKVNQDVKPSRGFVGAPIENTKEVTITKSSGGHFTNDSPPPFYSSDVYKKPNVIVVDSQSQYNSGSTDVNDDFLNRKEVGTFKEVVSTKTKRLRNRVQRTKDEDYFEDEACELDVGEGFSYTSEAYFPRSPSFSTKKSGPKPKPAAPQNEIAPPVEIKSKPALLPTPTMSSGRPYVHPTRIFRNQSQHTGAPDSADESYVNRSRYSNGTHNKYNVIPRYAKSRQRMNASFDNGNSQSSSPKSSAKANKDSSDLVHSVAHTAVTPTPTNPSSAVHSSSCSNERFLVPPGGIQTSEETNCSLKSEIQKNVPSGDNEVVGSITGLEFCTRWDALVKESGGSAFGPFIHSAARQTWSPWGDVSGTEASSPDLCSRPHSCDLAYDLFDNTGPNIISNQKCLSPVKPPTPTPIGAPPARELDAASSLSQHFKRQCVVNPIARPSSRNSRPDSMLSNRSSFEDLSVGRIVHSNDSSATLPPNTLLLTPNPSYAARNLIPSTPAPRQDFFGDPNFTPRFGDSEIPVPERPRTATNNIQPPQKAFEPQEQFKFVNELLSNYSVSAKKSYSPANYSAPPPNHLLSCQWSNLQVDKFTGGFNEVNPRPFPYQPNNNYDAGNPGRSFGHGNGEQLYAALQNRGSNAMESMNLKFDGNPYLNPPGPFVPVVGERQDFPDASSTRLYMKRPHAAVGAERIGNSRLPNQSSYLTSYEQP